ncbi:MAG: serine hydrolase [Sphingobacteriia bacterium]|nr:serine hydrolase [Sphingobacteriia bacterium]
MFKLWFSIIFLISYMSQAQDANYSYTSINKEKLDQSLAALENFYINNPVRLGISVTHIEKNLTYSYRGNEKFKMASTVKLPIAIYALSLVEATKLNLNEVVEVKQDQLIPYSNINNYANWPKMDVTFLNLMDSMIATSDNTATDIILNKIGGIAAVKQYFTTQYNGISIDRNMTQLFLDYMGYDKVPDNSNLLKIKEEFYAVRPSADKDNFARKLAKDEKDTTTPEAMNKIITDFYNKKFFGDKTVKFLLHLMSKAKGNMLPGFLTKDQAQIFNKPGMFSHEGKEYYFTISSDVGIITLPNGNHLSIAIYADTEERIGKDEMRSLIALASKTLYDYFYFTF